MGKYRKKPVVIEAICFNGLNIDEIKEFTKGKATEGFIRVPSEENGNAPLYAEMTIDTLEGQMTARMGDYIIKGVYGEFYPCKPDIFEQTYEKAE